MRLIEVSLRNFRGINQKVSVPISKFTALAGMNNSGKSTLLEALEIFFSEKAPDKDDLCRGSHDKDVEIECTFDGFPAQLVLDTQAVTNLKDEHLLSCKGLLVIRKTYNCGLVTPKLSGVASLCAHPSAEGYDDLISLKNTDLKKRAGELGVELSGVNKSNNVELRRALWRSAATLDIVERYISLARHEDGKRIWESLRKELPSFSLFRADRASTDQDSEAQDPIKTAITRAVRQHREALDAIAAEIHQAVQPILDETVRGMAAINPEMASSLAPRSTNPKWESVFKVSLTDEDTVPVNKWGSGSRRLLLMNFFRAQVEAVGDELQQRTMIYAIEEPETALHPSMQRKLLMNLLLLSELDDSQVMITTHSPALARLIPIQSLRRVVKDEGRTYIDGPDPFGVERLAQDLGVLPDHDVKLFIGVEGATDIDFLLGVHESLYKCGLTDLDLSRLVQCGEVVFIPLGGDNLGHWVSQWKNLAIPEFYLFDRDNKPDKPDFVAHARQLHELNSRIGVKATHTTFREIENYFAPEVIEAIFPGLSFSPSSQALCDISKEVSEALKGVAGHKPLKPKSVKSRLCGNADKITEKTLDRLGVLDEVVGWFSTMKQMLHA
ncbi:ATP-binding protein [Streptomyces sp. RKCA744]|uniref:ATP-binding protein n=1 Tax=Streptomyces sp. RKCA744 TaxID=2959340 RepID=UPI00209E432A|nr:ATP-binding protein [Streptomyces sp. RKCA744]MCO8307004.1 ATP-binding protein [Streptomyces sp. RKCA744]